MDEPPAYAVVGGLAVSARCEPRFTRDVDIAVACDDDRAAEAVVHGLRGQGFSPLTVLEHASGRLSTVRMLPPGGSPNGALVDLLFASSGAEREIAAAAGMLEVLPRVRMPIATVGHLMALKLLSVGPTRPKDASDLISLRAVATNEDLDACRRLLALINERGFHRGRDLFAAFATLSGSG